MIPVLVTTDKDRRGVFFGYIETEDQAREALAQERTVLLLRGARNCVTWSIEMHGVFGLAARGPDENCRIGPKTEWMQINGVTAVVSVSAAAVANWEAEPWK